MLKRLLAEINRQNTGGLFTYSVVIVDNDLEQSAESTVAAFSSFAMIPVKYCVESRRGIARARNKVVENASGDFVAFIDDDEFPCPDWLLMALNACKHYKADGVLGPVKRHFDEVPPAWLQESRFFVRRVNATGTRVDWREARTGNVLLRRETLAGDGTVFRPELISGEDVDFFRRKTEEGCSFVWCAEAEVFEVVPRERWKRSYLLKRALLRGESAVLRSECGAPSLIKSIVAVPIYAIALPFALLGGQHRFMSLMVRLCDHAGKILAVVGVHLSHGEYVSG